MAAFVHDIHSHGHEDFPGTGLGEEPEKMTIRELLEVAARLLPEEASLCCRLLSIVRNGPSEALTRPLGVLDSATKDVLGEALIVACKLHHPRLPLDGDENAEMSALPAATSELGVTHDEEREHLHHRTIELIGYKLAVPPFLPPPSIGCRRRRLYAMFDDPQSCIVARILELVTLLTILVSTVSFAVESMPAFRYRSTECTRLKDLGLPLTVGACEPHSDPSFWYIELVCILIFTVEYLARVSMHHTVLSGGKARLIDGTLKFMLKPMNAIDLLAILPFYVDLLLEKGQIGPMRILRLCRVLRLFKVVKHHSGMTMLKEVMIMSHQPLMILMFFNAIIVVIFGSLLYFIEGQLYSVDPVFTLPHLDLATNVTIEARFPTGVYVRPKPTGDGEYEPSPFRTIPRACWWVLVTMSTVGYGDMFPTSELGKCVAILCYYVGIIFLALPISVIGSNFDTVYHATMKIKESRLSSAQSDARRNSPIANGPDPSGFGWFPRTGSWRKNVFVILDDPSASRLGKSISLLLTTIILISTISFVMDSMEFLKSTPDVEKCKRELTVLACEPVSAQALDMLEIVCVAIFTFDYCLRIGLVHTAAPSECGLSGRVAFCSRLKTTIVYSLQWLNIIDLLAILPFYIALLGGSSGGASVLRVLRLVRVFRVLKMPKVRACAEMFIDIIRDSLPGLMLLFLILSLVCVLCSSLVHFAESSNYSVTDFEDLYPFGCYVRPTIDGFDVEVSPYKSIVHTFWWFFTTAMTVGYGDIVPTTTFGRIVGVFTFYSGIVLIGLKITVVSGCFNMYFPQWSESFGLRAERAPQTQMDTASGGEDQGSSGGKFKSTSSEHNQFSEDVCNGPRKIEV